MQTTTYPECEVKTIPFESTVFELQQAARYWHRCAWDLRLGEVYFGWFSAPGGLRKDYAYGRRERIRRAIGEEAYCAAVEDIDAEIREQIGDEDFATLTGRGDAKAYERLCDRIGAEHYTKAEKSEGVTALALLRERERAAINGSRAEAGQGVILQYRRTSTARKMRCGR